MTLSGRGAAWHEVLCYEHLLSLNLFEVEIVY